MDIRRQINASYQSNCNRFKMWETGPSEIQRRPGAWSVYESRNSNGTVRIAKNGFRRAKREAIYFDF